jgi:hypothetical protein
MEAQKAIKEIEANVQVLTDKKAKREEDFLRLTANIKQLKQELKIVQNDVAILHGAIQAYQGSIEVLSKQDIAKNEAVDGAA